MFVLIYLAYGLDVEKLTCIDRRQSPECEYLKNSGACQTHANIMAEECARTCDLCGTSF